MEVPVDLQGMLPRLDSNQQPFGERQPADGSRRQPTDQHIHPIVDDQNRPRSTGFSDGKVTVDLGPDDDMAKIRNAGRLVLDYLTVLAVYAHGATTYLYAQIRDRRAR